MKQGDEPILDTASDRDSQRSRQRETIKQRISSLLQEQPFCILCTQGEGQPYGSLIAFACSGDLRHLYFSTPKATRKHRLLSECRQVALVVDSRSSHTKDMKRISAVTITGKAVPLVKTNESDTAKKLLKSRHPYLAEFLDAESTALYRVDTVRYLHVTRFQEVTQWIP